MSAEASVQFGEFRLGPFLCLTGFVALLVALLQLPARFIAALLELLQTLFDLLKPRLLLPALLDGLAECLESPQRICLPALPVLVGEQWTQLLAVLLDLLLQMFVALPLFRQRLLALLQDRLDGPQFLLQLLGLALAGDQPVEVSLALLALPCQVVQALCQPLQLRGRLQESQFFRQRPLVQLPIERGQLASQFLLLLATLVESFPLAGIALAQTDQGLSQPLEGLLGADLLLVVVFTEGGEQLLGMVIGMLLAAADRTGLAVHQAGAQLLDAGAAGQTLALEQLAGDLQGLLRRLHLLGALAALSFQVEQCLLLLDHTLVEFAQASSQAGALVEGLLPFLVERLLSFQAIGLPAQFVQACRQVVRLAAMEGGPLRLQAFERFPGVGQGFFQLGELRLAFERALATLHEGGELALVGRPGVAERGESLAVAQCRLQLRLFRDMALLLHIQLPSGVALLGVALVRLPMEFLSLGQRSLQAPGLALQLESLAQRRLGLTQMVVGLGLALARLLQAGLQSLQALGARGLLLGALPLLLLGVPEFLLELLQAFDQSANRSQALQPLQGFPLRRQGVPGLPGLGQLTLCVLAGLQQPLLLGEPLLLAFQTLQCLLLLETRLGVGFQRRLEPGPGLLGQGQAAFQALLELLALLVGLAGALIGGFAQLAVQAGVGEFLQQCAAVVVAGLEEGAEFALGQQHGASELGEIEAELLLQLFAELAFLVRCQHLLGLQVLEALLALLQGAVRLVPGAPGFPAGAIAVAVDADEIHFGVAAGATAAQQVAFVVAGQLVPAIGNLAAGRSAFQPRRAAEQGQAQGVQHGALAGAGRTGDGEQAGAGQRFAGEVDFLLASEGGEVLQTDGENLHGTAYFPGGSSVASSTLCSRLAKSSSACASGPEP